MIFVTAGKCRLAKAVDLEVPISVHATGMTFFSSHFSRDEFSTGETYDLKVLFILTLRDKSQVCQ